ncbi:MAG: PDZ domain-containing protein [Rubrivivax sp.]|nr:PDZ domain-containing protein [Rubrivivax sp.]
MPSPAARKAHHPLRRLSGRLLVLGAAAVIAACGGNGYDDDGCSQPAQKDWVGSFMNDWYFWYRLSPRPNPGSFADALDYYDALLYTGTDPAFPADRFSRSESTESFNRFFGDGATMGYGVAVNGFEVQAGQPLYVRYVEPASDAAVKGVVRGDEVVSANGRTAAELIVANDYSVLTAANAGDRLTLQLRRNGVTHTVVVEAKVHNLTPVSGARVVSTPNGRLMGYLMVKDMVAQADAGLDSAFALFRSQNVQDLVVDLRYNGGGLVSIGGALASYIAGTRGFSGATPRTYAALLYNDKRAAANNQNFRFESRGNALGLARVYVLAGPRTASASEQVINGLLGVGVQVVTVGDTTFGKPVGSLPAGYCGTTYSAVNFESTNALNQGRFFDGFDATCPVPEDFTRATGAVDDPLLVSAAHHADNGACPALVASSKPALTRAEKTAKRRAWTLDEREAMVPR